MSNVDQKSTLDCDSPVESMKGMEDISKEQLISMNHFLEKRDEERKKENEELKELIKELQETHNQRVKLQPGLLDSIVRLTKQVSELTENNKKLQQQI